MERIVEISRPEINDMIEFDIVEVFRGSIVTSVMPGLPDLKFQL